MTPLTLDDIARLEELSERSVGGDLLPPGWAEIARSLPSLLATARLAAEALDAMSAHHVRFHHVRSIPRCRTCALLLRPEAQALLAEPQP